MTASHYDSFAKAYSAQNETGLFNAHYERPAMLRLANDVSGRRILDAGGVVPGALAVLRDAGAVVTLNRQCDVDALLSRQHCCIERSQNVSPYIFQPGGARPPVQRLSRVRWPDDPYRSCPKADDRRTFRVGLTRWPNATVPDRLSRQGGPNVAVRSQP